MNRQMLRLSPAVVAPVRAQRDYGTDEAMLSRRTSGTWRGSFPAATRDVRYRALAHTSRFTFAAPNGSTLATLAVRRSTAVLVNLLDLNINTGIAWLTIARTTGQAYVGTWSRHHYHLQ